MRISAPRRVRRIVAVAAGAAVGATAYAGLASAGWLGHPDDPAVAGRHATSLLERPECARPVPVRPAAGQPSAGVDQVAAVTVRRTAMLRIDVNGRVMAAWTNTGCAPRAGDDLFVQLPDGSIAAADRSLAAQPWAGDFREPGIFVEQPARTRR